MFAIVDQKMDSSLKIRLKKKIKVYKSKCLTANTRDILKFLRSEAVPTDFVAGKKNSLAKFVSYQLKIVDNVRYVTKHRAGNRRKRVTRDQEGLIKRLAANKTRRSIRKIAENVGVCYKTVANVLHIGPDIKQTTNIKLRS